jgi:hypothetical protein
MNPSSNQPRIAWTHQPVARRRAASVPVPRAWPAWMPRLAEVRQAARVATRSAKPSRA